MAVTSIVTVLLSGLLTTAYFARIVGCATSTAACRCRLDRIVGVFGRRCGISCCFRAGFGQGGPIFFRLGCSFSFGRAFLFGISLGLRLGLSFCLCLRRFHSDLCAISSFGGFSSFSSRSEERRVGKECRSRLLAYH